MSTVSVKIQYDAELLRALERRLDPAVYQRAAARVVQRGAVEVRDLIAAYPPEGSYNRPAGPGSRWYQRHFGPRWMRVDGTIGGRNTSEMLQKSWRIKTTGQTGVVYTGVSYAPFVQGDQQAWFHRQHGWHTARDTLERWRRTRAVTVVQEELRRVLGGEHG